MFKVIVSFICICLSFSAVAETVYKSKNPDGSVEFSDVQKSGSEEIKVRKPTSYAPTQLPSVNLPTKKLSPADSYQLSITSPTNDSTVVGQNDVTVSITISPSIQSQHQVRYQLAGKSIVNQKTSATFKNVSRGTHQISVTVVNSEGEAIIPTATTTIHMKRFFKKP